MNLWLAGLCALVWDAGRGTDMPCSFVHPLPPLVAERDGGEQLALPLEETSELSTAPLSSPNLL